MIRCSLLFGSVLGLAMIAPASAQGAAPTAQARGAGASDEAATTGARAETTADVVPGTGDAVVDRLLVDINDYAARHREAFIDELVRYFDAPRPLVTDVLVERRWAAGDVYYACALARVAGRPAARCSMPGPGTARRAGRRSPRGWAWRKTRRRRDACATASARATCAGRGRCRRMRRHERSNRRAHHAGV